MLMLVLMLMLVMLLVLLLVLMMMPRQLWTTPLSRTRLPLAKRRHSSDPAFGPVISLSAARF